VELLAHILKLHDRQLVECSQDQWDIYKLDPLYECRVRSYPKLAVISKISPKPKMNNGTPQGPKRRVSPTPEPVLPPPNPRKKVNKIVVEEQSDEESEVEAMIIDDGPCTSRPRPVGLAKIFRNKVERNRKDRREKAARRAGRLAREEEAQTKFELFADTAPHSKGVPPEPVGKRKGLFSTAS
jgi:type IV secretory pathway VirB10-like protein